MLHVDAEGGSGSSCGGCMCRSVQPMELQGLLTAYIVSG